MKAPSVSVLIPTFGRDQLLVDTLNEVLAQVPAADEIVVLDQTPEHEPGVSSYLASGSAAGRFRWIQMEHPSLCAARNRGVQEARSEVVLFVDDDVLLPPGFVEAHRRSYLDREVGAVVGKIFVPRPGEAIDRAAPERSAASIADSGGGPWAAQVLGSNFSVRKALYEEVGGFDEQLVGHVYYDESDFSRRLTAAGHRIRYEADAWQVHLKAPTGGCRIPGNTAFPEWMKSVNFLTFFFRYPLDPSARQALKSAWRAGPLRRENVVAPSRWVKAWLSFGYAIYEGWRRGRADVLSPFSGSRSRTPDHAA